MNPIYRFNIATNDNLFNPYLSGTETGALLVSDGTTVANSSYNTSGYISVSPRTLYEIFPITRICYYNSLKVRIGTYVPPTQETVTLRQDDKNCFYNINSNKNTGRGSSSYSYMFFQVQAGQRFRGSGTIGGASMALFTFWDSLGNVVGYKGQGQSPNATYTNLDVTVPQGATEMGFAWLPSQPATLIQYFDPSTQLITTPENTAFVRISVPVAYWSGLYVYLQKEVNPNYKDDLAKEYALETNQRFYRPKLSGKISFVGVDYDYLAQMAFETEFILTIYKSDDGGVTWSEYYTGKFMKTDCEWSDDDRKCTVQPDTLDEYNDVLAGLEKEYNLIPLAPAITRLSMKKRPLIQVYLPGDSVVSCFLGGLYWEQDANAVSDRNALVNTYHFALCNMLKEMNVTPNSTGDATMKGLYAGRMTLEDDNFTGTLSPDSNNGYYIRVTQVYIRPFFSYAQIDFVRRSDGVVLYRYVKQFSGNEVWDNAEFTMTAVSGSGATGTLTVEMATYNVYVRYLLDVEQILGLNTYPIPADDIVDNNRNYRYSIGYAIDVAYISNQTTNTPTEYGLADNGGYFTPPYSIWNQKYYPIARSTWRYASIWFGFAIMDSIIEVEGRKEYTLRDTYPLYSVISVLLKQFAPGITHDGTPEYSQFLYGANNPITYTAFRLLLTQKTNIKYSYYDQPAQKAPITLQQVTNMLRDCFRCFWYIEDGKFKIEHIQWFRNGGQYGYNQIVDYDLTTLLNPRNRKTWGFASSAWSFDKVDMPERYQFAWMDDCTRAFEGFPIEVLSKYVTAGKIEDVNVSNFNADIDYMLLNPSNVSDDGFALFAALPSFQSYNQTTQESTLYWQGKKYDFLEFVALVANVSADIGAIYATGTIRGVTSVLATFWDANGKYLGQSDDFVGTGTVKDFTDQPISFPAGTRRVAIQGMRNRPLAVNILPKYSLPFIERTIDNEEYVLQNGYLSMVYLQPNYYVYDLPARNVRINQQSTYAYGIERKKKQTVVFPTNQDINPMHLIKTYIGNGQIDKISVNLCSRSNKVTLKYDTE